VAQRARGSVAGSRGGSCDDAVSVETRPDGVADHTVNAEHLVTATTDAHAPTEVVWGLLCRFGDYADWLESTVRVLRADEEVALGAGFEERSRISGVWMATIRWTLTELDPFRRMAFHGEGVAVLDDLGFSVDLTDRGTSSELSITLWYTPRLGPLGWALDVLTRANVTNDQKRSVRTLATLAELRAHPGETAD
jgi:Polyketide cyclase / dehydrase and lipid transport